jgi:hypothetical protein
MRGESAGFEPMRAGRRVMEFNVHVDLREQMPKGNKHDY